MLLSTTLCLTAAAVIVNIWLGIRIGQLRHKKGISVGHGEDELLMRRMRAQLNFIEQTPLTLLLVGGVELAGHGGAWLAPAGAAFILGRIAHAYGMDDRFKAGRGIGMATSMLFQLALVVVAVLAALHRL